MSDELRTALERLLDEIDRARPAWAGMVLISDGAIEQARAALAAVQESEDEP